jgi:hypothetical protein
MSHPWGFDPGSPGAKKLACAGLAARRRVTVRLKVDDAPWFCRADGRRYRDDEQIELMGFEADHLIREGRAEYVSQRLVTE